MIWGPGGGDLAVRLSDLSGHPLAQRRQSHVALTMLLDHLPPRLHSLAGILIDAVIGYVTLVLLVASSS